MVGAIAVLATLGFVGWLVFRSVKDRSIKAHMVSYGVAVVSGIFTYAFFLSLDFPQLIKIVASILLGIILIFVAAILQRRKTGRS